MGSPADISATPCWPWAGTRPRRVGSRPGHWPRRWACCRDTVDSWAGCWRSWPRTAGWSDRGRLRGRPGAHTRGPRAAPQEPCGPPPRVLRRADARVGLRDRAGRRPSRRQGPAPGPPPRGFDRPAREGLRGVALRGSPARSPPRRSRGRSNACLATAWSASSRSAPGRGGRRPTSSPGSTPSVAPTSSPTSLALHDPGPVQVSGRDVRPLRHPGHRAHARGIGGSRPDKFDVVLAANVLHATGRPEAEPPERPRTARPRRIVPAHRRDRPATVCST